MITITIILEEKDDRVESLFRTQGMPATEEEIACADELVKSMMASNGGMNIKSITDITFDK